VALRYHFQFSMPEHGGHDECTCFSAKNARVTPTHKDVWNTGPTIFCKSELFRKRQELHQKMKSTRRKSSHSAEYSTDNTIYRRWGNRKAKMWSV
jgi:hypothetical protein